MRIVRCFDPNHISPKDYLARLAKSGHLVRNHADSFAATELGKQHIYLFEQGVAELMQSVDLGEIPPEDVQKLLEYDLRIGESLKAASRPPGPPDIVPSTMLSKPSRKLFGY